MKEKLEALKAQALEELAAVTSLDALKDLRVKYLGKKGPMTEILRGMGKLPYEEKFKMMEEACSFVNLEFKELTNKYPFELSGGQMQRLMIARIFLLRPKILLADEPTSMIDACSRSTILDMLLKLRDEIQMTVIFITHDIGLAYYISDKVYIMEHGKFVESGPAEECILHPTADYTKRLISDVPKIYEEWDLSTV